MISKAEAIRQVMKNDLSLSNSEVKRRVQARFGMTVETNQINNLFGAYRTRRYSGSHGQLLARAARDFLRQVAFDKRLAQMLISCCESNSMGGINETN